METETETETEMPRTTETGPEIEAETETDTEPETETEVTPECDWARVNVIRLVADWYTHMLEQNAARESTNLTGDEA